MSQSRATEGECFFKLTYFSIVDDTRLPSVEFVEQNVRVRVRKHQSPREVVSRDEAVRLTVLILTFENLESILHIEVRILKQQLTLLLDNHLSLQELVPQLPVQVSGVLREHLFVRLEVLQVGSPPCLKLLLALLRFGHESVAKF